MYQYFKMLEDSTQNSSITYDSIRDLTIDLAKSGGYYRGVYKFKNGNERERTLYTKPFDDVLTSLWLCFYKKLFVAKLSVHPELAEYHVHIINKTFYITMSCINLDKLVCDDVINRYVNLALTSRIGEVMGKMRSKYHFVQYKKGDKAPFVFKNAIDNQAVSLNHLEECNYKFSTYDDLSDLDIELDIKNRLIGNPFGERFLEALLFSNKRINLKAIDKSVRLTHDECTEENKRHFADAYNEIKRVLLSYNSSDLRKRFRRILPSSIKYSFESGD